MDADLDLLLIAVYCTADDFLPARPGNARRRISDAEVITLCVAQAMMGAPCDERFLRAARRQLGHLFPHLPERTAFHKRRLRLSGAIEALIRECARHSPGFYDDLLLVDSTPVECARSRETVKRGGSSSLADALANAADYGYCASHSRFFWGFRLHAIFALDGTPRALALTSPKLDEKLVCLQLVERCERQPGQILILIGDKNFRGKDFEAELVKLDARIMRPRRKDERGRGPHLTPIRQRIESIFQTCKDILTLERHGARTLANLRVRLLTRFAALGLSDDPRPGRPATITAEQVEDVVVATLESTPENATHWSRAKMAERSGLSKSTIGRIWRAFELKPHRADTFKLSSDPLFVEKVYDVVALYLNPPEGAVVLCVDEKSQVQALARSQPAFPMMPGMPEKRTHDYLRHGTTSLFAAFNTEDGTVISSLHRRHRTIEFKKFLAKIDSQVPEHLDVHLVCDNYGTHKSPAIRRWLDTHPRFHMHHTPTYSSWINQVERWFAYLTNDLLRRSDHRSVQALESDIREWVNQ